ncbi:MAG: DsbA family protein [Buchnera aphidicola (Nurudea shiraii)]
MKKILLIFILTLFGFQNVDKLLIEKEYNTLNQKIPNTPQIIEFFSFLCPHCYEFEKLCNLDYYVKKQISSAIKIEKYHTSFLGGKFGRSLTRIWEISKIIGLDQKVLIPLFKKIQDEKTIVNSYTLKKEFLKLTSIDEKELKFLWNCFAIKSILYNQNIIQNAINLDRVPLMLINGKYIINNANISHESTQDFIKKYTHIIQLLLEK